MASVLSNIDILSELTQHHLSLNDSESLLDALSNVRRQRMDPTILFSRLVDKPLEFMKLMINNNIILSGSRAVRFMYPYFDCSDSNWDFYCSTDKSSEKLIQHLISIGAEVDRNIDEHKTSATDDVYVKYYTLYHRGKLNKIQVICSIEEDGSIFHVISKFHSTVVQCFITGYAAVSMYDILSSNNVMLDWNTENTRKFKRHMSDETDECTKHKITIDDIRDDDISILTHNLNDDGTIIESIRNTINSNRNVLLTAAALKVDVDPTTNIDKIYEDKLNAISTFRSRLQAINPHLTEEQKTTIIDRFRTLSIIYCDCIKPNRQRAALTKYQNRGFKLISSSEYIEILKENGCLDVDTHLNTERYNLYVYRRHLGDDISKVTSLVKYMSTEIRAECEEKINNIMKFQWYESLWFPKIRSSGNIKEHRGIYYNPYNIGKRIINDIEDNDNIIIDGNTIIKSSDINFFTGNM